VAVGAPLYFFPCVEQRELLYQSLFFHEFGHLLYACHKSELDDLVGELQLAVFDSLLPASQRNDRQAAIQAEHLQIIINNWYAWTQELFCDAVGFNIGGPCFLRAFSTYLSDLTETDFYQRPDQLEQSQHPVSWLRIQFLAKRAAREGFTELARDIEEEWRQVANTLQINEDYHGFYIDALEAKVEQIVADMLTEAGPRHFSDTEATGSGWSPLTDSLVQLLNLAWQVYDSKPEQYEQWEIEHVAKLLGS
jgi:hypothetical protein